MKEHSIHPIAVVSKMTGLSAHVIRAWEKRYGVVVPVRTEGNHRLYTDEDVDRLLLLREAVKTGRSIGRIAKLQNDELRELIGSTSRSHEIRYEPLSTVEDNLIISENYVRECLESVKLLDSKRLAETLYRSSVSLGHITVVEKVVIPFMRKIGDFWSEGRIRILHEHMASVVVRTFLGDLLRSLDYAKDSPRGIATTLAGERHELGALTAAVAAALEGWHIQFLGSNLPWEEIAQAAELSRAHVVLISIILVSDEIKTISEVDKLRSFLPEHIVILMGGRLPPSLRPTLERPGIEWLDGMRELRLRLHDLSIATSNHP